MEPTVVDILYKPVDFSAQEKKTWVNVKAYPSEFQYHTPQSLGNSNVVYNIQFPAQTACDPNLRMRCRFRVTINGTTTHPSNIMFVAGQLALRPLPLNLMMLNPSVSLNGYAVSSSTNQYLHKLVDNYWLKQLDKIKWSSTTVTMPDNCANYASTVARFTNPLASNINRIPGLLVPGGAGIGAPTIISNTATQAVLEWDLVENLMQYPFNMINETSTCLYVPNGRLDIKLNFTDFQDPSLIRYLSQADGGYTNITSYSVNILEHNIITEFYSLPPHVIHSFDEIMQYPYKEYDRLPSSTNVNVPSGGTMTLVSNSMTLASIPNKIYIWAADYNNSYPGDPSQPASVFVIQSINLLFNNKSGMLTTLRAQDFYETNIRNGMTSLDFAETFGSNTTSGDTPFGFPLILVPGVDFELPEGMHIGTSALSTTFQITATFLNNKSTTVTTANLIILFEFDGVWQVNTRSAQVSATRSPFTPETFHVAKHISGHYDQFFPEDELRGGNIWNSIKKGLGHANRFLKSSTGRQLTTGLLNAGATAFPQYRNEIGMAKALKKKYGYGLGSHISASELRDMGM